MPDDISQLTDVQRRFVQALRDVPPPEGAALYTQVPYTGAQPLQGIEAPNYAAAYQPAQSFDDPAYQKKLYEWEQEVRRTAEATRAEQAIQAGIRFIYQRRYDEDLKKGLPESQAFARMMQGIALHGPKTDPIKAFEAFRARPAPQPQMMKFGTNEVPVIMETDRYGAQRARPVPQSALPVPPLGAAGEVLKHPTTGAEMGVRFPTGPKSGQILGQPKSGATPLSKAEETIARKAMVDAAEELRAQANLKTPNLKAVEQATREFQSASNALLRLSPQALPQTPSTPEEKPTPSTKKLYFNPETGQLQEKPYASQR